VPSQTLSIAEMITGSVHAAQLRNRLINMRCSLLCNRTSAEMVPLDKKILKKDLRAPYLEGRDRQVV
jgi:hypothetical protein